MPFISTIGGGSAQGFGRTVLEQNAFGAASTTQSTDTTYTIGGIQYQSHTWTQANQSGNSITFTNESGNGNVQADVLLIAGGGGGAVGTGTDKVFYENDISVAQSYTISSGKNAMSAGPITLAGSVVVTIPSGSTWTVV